MKTICLTFAWESHKCDLNQKYLYIHIMLYKMENKTIQMQLILKIINNK